MKNKEKIGCIGEMLDLKMDETRIKALEPTYADWMERAKRLDAKIGEMGLGTPTAANIFIH